MSLGSETMAAEFSVVKDPRLSTTPEAYRAQFDLVRQLTASLGKVNATVNQIRRLKQRFAVLAAGPDAGTPDLVARAAAVVEQLSAVEAVLVDVHRESDRDVLRNPAGLNDTLVDLINTVSVADTAPTKQAAAVSNEIMARVDAEIGTVERLIATEIAAVNRLALERRSRRLAAAEGASYGTDLGIPEPRRVAMPAVAVASQIDTVEQAQSRGREEDFSAVVRTMQGLSGISV